MLEMKITITAPDLAAAIVSLANALEGKGKITPTDKPAAPVASAPAAQHATPTPTVNPTQAHGAPLSATPAPAVAPVANPAPTAQYAAPVTPVTAPVAQAPAAPVVPTSAPTYTLEMIAAAGSSLIDAGKLDALMALLGKYGVDSLTNLAPEHYGAIAMELRALGARL